MSDYDWDDDYEEDAPKQESNPLRDARNRGKQLAKQNKELLERLEKAEAGLRERSVKDAIKSKGLPEKVASLIPKDLTTSEEVDAWVESYADIFGVPAQEAGDPQTPDGGEQPNAQFEALKRISNTQAGGQPFSNDEAQIAALIAGATDEQALNKILFGNPDGPAAS
jgi:hypothetical protein